MTDHGEKHLVEPTRAAAAGKTAATRAATTGGTRGAEAAARTDRAKAAGVRPEMWALVFDTEADGWDTSTGFRKAKVPRPELDEALDPLDAGRVIVKLRYTGFCGSDAGIWFRTSFKRMIHESLRIENKTTRVIGHEVYGEVVEAGSVARARNGFRLGDTVAAESHIVCGKCHQCLMGQTHVCINEKILGITRDGGFAEYIKLPASVLWRTDPDKIREEVAAVQEPFGNAVHACTAVDVRGKTVAVFGTGAIGQFSILVARALGAAHIIGVEPDPHNADIALKLGADEVIRFQPEPDGWRADDQVVDRLREAAHADGVDVAMEMAGHNSSVNNAFQSVRRGGEVVLFGLRGGDFQIQDFSHLIVKGITIKNVIGRRIFATWEITKNLLETTDNGIQEKIWRHMLNQGKGTIQNVAAFDTVTFEKKIRSYAKVLVKW